MRGAADVTIARHMEIPEARPARGWCSTSEVCGTRREISSGLSQSAREVRNSGRAIDTVDALTLQSLAYFQTV